MRGSDELLGRLDLSQATQLTFGRDASRVDVALEHASISRHHATLTFDREAAFISDFDSTHGTFLARPGEAERRLRNRDLTPLEPGDVIRFGESSRRYLFNRSRPDPPEAVTVHVRVPANTVGRLIGRGGATINAVQERTKALVDLVDHANHLDPPPFRLVKIKGSLQAVAAARLELLAITAGDPPPPLPADADAGPATQRFRYASTNIRGDDDGF